MKQFVLMILGNRCCGMGDMVVDFGDSGRIGTGFLFRLHPSRSLTCSTSRSFAVNAASQAVS